MNTIYQIIIDLIIAITGIFISDLISTEINNRLKDKKSQYNEQRFNSLCWYYNTAIQGDTILLILISVVGIHTWYGYNRLQLLLNTVINKSNVINIARNIAHTEVMLFMLGFLLVVLIGFLIGNHVSGDWLKIRKIKNESKLVKNY